MLNFKEYLEVTDIQTYLGEAYMGAALPSAPFKRQSLGLFRHGSAPTVSRSEPGLEATVQMVKKILERTRSMKAVTNRLRSLGLSPDILNAVIDGVGQVYPKAAEKIRKAMGLDKS